MPPTPRAPEALDPLTPHLERLRARLREAAARVRDDTRDDPLAGRSEVVSDATFERRLRPRAPGRPDDVLARLDREAETDAASPLARLARLFGLSPFERDALLLALAPEVDPGFLRLYAYVQDDASLSFPTPHLALLLFGDAPENRAAFHPDAPLRRHRLLALDPPAPGAPRATRPLRLDERVADHLLGRNRLDETVAEWIRPVPPAPVPPTHAPLLGALTRWAATAPDARLLVNLVGPRGAGKLALAAALARTLGLRLHRLDPRALPTPIAPALRLLEREAALLGLAYYVDTTDAEGPAFQEIARELRGLVVLGGPERFAPNALAVRVPRPDADARREVWRAAFGADAEGSPLGERLGDLAHQFELGPHAVLDAVNAARARARLRDPSARPSPEDAWAACRDLPVAGLGGLARRIPPAASWEDLVLPDDALRRLREMAAHVARRVVVLDEWGFAARLHRGLGVTALFSGASGTGKTMAAEVLARDLGLDLYRVDLASVVSKYIGETEKNLRRVFDAAEESGAILFFDEADALFGRRTEVKDSHDRYANVEVDYLLQRMEEHRGIAILATNRKGDLDRAFLRRLRFVVDFPFPDAADRLRMWRRAFPPQAKTEGLDPEALSRLEVAGGNIRNIALAAAFLAADEGRPIGMAHVLQAARREYAKMDRPLSEADLARLLGRERA